MKLSVFVVGTIHNLKSCDIYFESLLQESEPPQSVPIPTPTPAPTPKSAPAPAPTPVRQVGNTAVIFVNYYTTCTILLILCC